MVSDGSWCGVTVWILLFICWSLAGYLVVSESHSKIFSELHGVQAVLGALRAFPDCADLVLNSFMFLWSLSVHGECGWSISD